MDDILHGLPGIISIADDIVVYGSTPEQHDEHLRQLMLRAREQGLVFNPTKCVIKTDHVTFFGNIYSKDGIHPDPKKSKLSTI